MDTINNIGKSHTVIIIAHRLSTIKNADRILLIGDRIKTAQEKDLKPKEIDSVKKRIGERTREEGMRQY